MRSVRFLGILPVLALALTSACSDVTSPLSPTVANAAKGVVAGGGTVATAINMAGQWNGSWAVPFKLLDGTIVANPNAMTLHVLQDAQGNLTGSICSGHTVAPCFDGITGKADSKQVVLNFIFPYKGVPTPIVCPDGSLGLEFDGTFRGDTAGGTYAFNNCAGPAAVGP